MKKYLTKVSGTQIFRGTGPGYINHKYANYDEQYFEIILDDSYPPSCIHVLDNGLLIIHTTEGDEQPTADMYILKDWETELIEEEIGGLQLETVALMFDNYHNPRIPKKLKEKIEDFENTKKAKAKAST